MLTIHLSLTSLILLFLLSIVVVILASMLLYHALVRVGSYFHCPDRFLGLLAALAADSAEIASAFTAFHFNQHDLGFGIILGSNIFNLASLFGLSALLTGTLRFNHQEILFNGTISFLTTIICVLLISGSIAPWSATLLCAIILVPYFISLSSPLKSIATWRIPTPGKKFLIAALKDDPSHKRLPSAEGRLFRNILLSLTALFLIFVGCLALIDSSLHLGKYWNIPPAIIGTVVIAILTSLPNMLTTLPMAFRKHEMAVVIESLNSNTLNIFLGICLPAVIYGIGKVSTTATFSVWWLLGMTILTLYWGYTRKGLFRKEGIAVVGFSLLFFAILLYWKL